MTELNLGASTFSTVPAVARPKHKPSRMVKAMLALLLGLFAPGLGQVYARRPWRGLLMALLLAIFLVLAGELHLMILSATRMFVSIAVSILLRLYYVADGCLLAWQGAYAETHLSHQRASSALAVVLILALGTYPFPDLWLNHFAHFRAFRVPSGSMCPTICVGDRIVVATDAFRERVPQRGDLIAFHYHDGVTVFLKRVIGTQGDRVIFGPETPISINGNKLKLPHPCGSQKEEQSDLVEGISAKSLTVPPASLFVIGDNLGNSFDSRIDDFGFVKPSQLVGKPAFIYWSPDRSRIGCELH
jgi:signal peptidase I